MLVREVCESTIHSLAFAEDGSLLAGTKDGRALNIPPFGDPTTIFDRGRPDFQESLAINTIRPLGTGCVLATSAGLIHVSPPGYHLFWAVIRASVADLEVLDDQFLAVGLGDRNRVSPGSFALFSHNLKPHEPRFPEPKGVRCVAVNRGGGLVAWSSGHQKVTVWNPRGQDPIPIPLKHTSPAIAFHPEGTRLAAAQEWDVIILDIAKRHEVARLSGHKGRVTCLAYRPDGRTIATGSWDGAVRLWDADGRARATLSAPLGRISTLTYSADGSLLAAAGEKGTVATWDMD